MPDNYGTSILVPPLTLKRDYEYDCHRPYFIGSCFIGDKIVEIVISLLKCCKFNAEKRNFDWSLKWVLYAGHYDESSHLCFKYLLYDRFTTIDEAKQRLAKFISENKIER